MAKLMRAKFNVFEVKQNIFEDKVQSENISMSAVTEKAFDAEGNNEDNTYAKFTPSAKLEITISNPALVGKIVEGQKFYVDFVECVEEKAGAKE